jgi:alkylation response protein AidB-like acyl-CoA dehydrogenase
MSGAIDLSEDERALAEVVERCVADHADLTLLARGEAGAPGLQKALVGLGAAGVMLSETDGGSGLGLIGLTLVAEAMGRHGVGADVMAGALAAHFVAAGGGPAQRARWGEGLASGALTAAIALHEGDGAWAPEDWRLAGERLSGAKRDVSAAAAPDLYLVGLAAGALTVVEAGATARLTPLGALDFSRRLHVLELDAAAHAPLSAAEGLGERLYSALSILAAAEAWGAASRALDMAVEYAGVRRQFGRPIGAFQALKHQLADMAVETAPARFLVWRAARAWDAGSPEASRWASLAKAHAASVAVRTCRAAVRAHGGIGYTQDYPLHLFLRKAMHAYADLGSPARHRERAAALAGWGRTSTT